MYEYCLIKKKQCEFVGKSKEITYCGFAPGENRIEKMKSCPRKNELVGKRKKYQ